MALTKVTGQVINATTDLVVGVTTVGGGLSATDGFFSGIITAVGDASFSGNVSVGGTLTYEDVTNVDSVGLITARKGISVTGGDIKVGSAITISQDNIWTSGIVTATSIGAGTSMAAAGLTGALPTISGANLTGITQTTINTNADNRLITGSGTANTLNGEANLTYDGNNIAQAIDASGEGLNLTATGNYYPEIEFNANRSGANNTLAYLNAKWNSNPVAAISFNAGSDTTNKDDGYMTFVTRTSGGAEQEALRITSDQKLLVGATSASNSSIAEFTKSVAGGGQGCHITVENTSTNSVNNTAGVHLKTDQGVAKFYTFRAAETWLQSRAGGTSDLILQADGSSKMVLKTNGSERLRIASDGKATFYGGTVARALNVNSTHTSGGEIVCFDNGVNNHYGALVVSAGEIDRECRLEAAYGGGFMTFWTQTNGGSAGERMRIDPDGKVVIGSTTATETFNVKGYVTRFQRIDVNSGTFERLCSFVDASGTERGNIKVSNSATQFNTSSDYRLKENISLISDGITRLKQLKPSRFNWKSDASIKVDGFIAHEVTAVPEAVSGTKDQVVVQSDITGGSYSQDRLGEPIYQVVDYSKFVPLLTAALQEEIAKREALEARIAALES